MTPFNPADQMVQVSGRNYLPVAARVLWARREHPEWSIITEPTDVAGGSYMRATILDETGRLLATAHKAIRPEGKGAIGQYPVESAETGAIGRALSLCGYGTLAGDLDEGDELADAPIGSDEAQTAAKPPKRAKRTETPAKPTKADPAYWEAVYGRVKAHTHLEWADANVPKEIAKHPLVAGARVSAVAALEALHDTSLDDLIDEGDAS